MKILTDDEIIALLDAVLCADIDDCIAAERVIDKIRANNEELKSRQPLYDWSEAPEWAHYAACDRSGNAWWFENAPEVIEYGRYEPQGGKSRAMRGTFEYNWRDSLEKRPNNEETTK